MPPDTDPAELAAIRRLTPAARLAALKAASQGDGSMAEIVREAVRVALQKRSDGAGR